MLSHPQALDDLQPAVVLNHIQSLKPTVHNALIGELFQNNDISITHSGGAHLKDLSSSRSAATESAWVAALSNIFENGCEFQVILMLYLGYIASDSFVIDILCPTKFPHHNAMALFPCTL